MKKDIIIFLFGVLLFAITFLIDAYWIKVAFWSISGMIFAYGYIRGVKKAADKKVNSNNENGL